MRPDEHHSYYLTAGTDTYHVSTRTQFHPRNNDVLVVGFRLGGQRKGCVSITVNALTKTLHINSVDFNEKCVVNGPMTRGVGTVKMVRVALSFMVTKYLKWFSDITLDDASLTECRFGNDVRMISLMYSYIAVNGQTWYEQKFGATLKYHHDLYAARIQKLVDRDFKAGIAFYTLPISLATTDEEEVKTIEDAWERAHTVQQFFRDLQATFKKEYCRITFRWLDLIIDNVVLEGTAGVGARWVVNPATFQRVPFVEEETDVALPDDVAPMVGGSIVARYHGGTDCSVRYGWSWSDPVGEPSQPRRGRPGGRAR